jgi:hypothetical protein
MKKIFITLYLTLQTLYAASSEEISQYLSLSHSEQDVIMIAQVFDSMRAKQENNESNGSTNDVTIVYQEYLEAHLSSNEIQKAIVLYNQPIMQSYITEVKTFHITDDDMKAFLENLEEEPLQSDREVLIEDMMKTLVNDTLQLNFYRSMMQRYPDRISDSQNSEANLTSSEQSYLESIKTSTRNRLLYGTQTFSNEEILELKDAIESAIFTKVKRVENEALVQIMNDFIRGIVSKPKRLKPIESEKR